MPGPGRPARWRTPSWAGGSASLGDRQTEAAARKVAYRLDPHGVPVPDPGRAPAPAGHPAAGAGHHVPADRVPAGRPRGGREGRAGQGGRPAPRRGRPAQPGPDHGRHPVPAAHRTSRRGRCPGRGAPGDDRHHPARRRRRARRPDRRRTDPRTGRARDLLRDTATRDGLAAPALHPPGRRGAGRDGLPAPRVPRTAAPAAGGPRPVLPHLLVRGPGPARRPRHGLGRRRCHQRSQRPRPVRSLQLRQTSPRLARPTRTRRRRRPGRDHHPHRPHLHEPTTTVTRPSPCPPPRPLPSSRGIDWHGTQLPLEERFARLLAA